MTQKARKLGRSAAAVAAAALIVAGTFSWRDLSQSKVNEFQGGNRGVTDVTLVEDFEENDNWKPGGQDAVVNKDVWVKNSGEQDVYVRLKLSEYLESVKYDYYTYTAEYADKYGYQLGEKVRFAINSDGDYIECVATTQDNTYQPVNGMNNQTFTGDRVCKVGDKYYLIAQGADGEVTDMDDTNRNGQIGKYMVRPDDSTVEALLGGQKNNVATWHNHLWLNDDNADAELTDNSGKVHDFIQWTLGTGTAMELSVWNALTSDEQKDINEDGGIWLLDTDSADGWAYYSKALKPEGTEEGGVRLDRTGFLLDAATLLKQPVQGNAGGSFYYSINVQMDAVTQDDLPLWLERTTDGGVTSEAATAEAKTLIKNLQEATVKVGADYYAAVDTQKLIYQKVNSDGTPLDTPEYFRADKPILEPDVVLTPVDAADITA